MKLDPHNRSRSRFHLGYGNTAGIGAGDVARLEESFDRVYDNYQIRRIIEILDRCDETYQYWFTGKKKEVTQELIAGDINRSVTRTMDPIKERKAAHERYLECVDELAQQLWVANYRQDRINRYRFERSGGEYLNILPGIADTSVGASIYTIAISGGGFGIPAY